MTYTVVDLGSKKCGAIDVFRKRHKGTFGGFADLSPEKCVAVDRNESCREEAVRRGYTFMKADVMDPAFEWPRAGYYLAWDFLEHLPSLDDSDRILRRMVERSTHGVWLRMPSFEADAIRKLDDLGLRYSWTTWAGHRSPYTVDRAASVIEAVPGWRIIKRCAVTTIAATTDEHIVPKSASFESVRYDASMGPKPEVTFKPPLPAVTDVVGVLTRAAIPIERWETTYSKLIALLTVGTPFSFNRFGDGEWRALLAFDCEWSGRFAKNKRVSCGLHGTDANMAAALKTVILDRQASVLGLQPLTARVMGDAVSEWLTRHNRNEKSWANSDALHYASMTGRLGEFVSLAKPRKPVLVGPAHLSAIKTALGVLEHVVIPDSDCWQVLSDIEARTDAAIANVVDGGIVFISAGPAAKVLIHRLVAKHGSRCSFVDTGAVWDVYVGKSTRRYHSKVNVGQLA
jgi:hypothetical protein